MDIIKKISMSPHNFVSTLGRIFGFGLRNEKCFFFNFTYKSQKNVPLGSIEWEAFCNDKKGIKISLQLNSN